MRAERFTPGKCEFCGVKSPLPHGTHGHVSRPRGADGKPVPRRNVAKMKGGQFRGD